LPGRTPMRQLCIQQSNPLLCNIYIYKIAQSVSCAGYLLPNGSTCSSELLHADTCRRYAWHRLGLLSIGVVVGKKMKLFLPFAAVTQRPLLLYIDLDLGRVGRTAVTRSIRYRTAAVGRPWLFTLPTWPLNASWHTTLGCGIPCLTVLLQASCWWGCRMLGTLPFNAPIFASPPRLLAASVWYIRHADFLAARLAGICVSWKVVVVKRSSRQ